MSLDHHVRRDIKPNDTAALLLMHSGATTYGHLPSPERRGSTDGVVKCYHKLCYEREQQNAREIQILHEAFSALTLEKDKEIACLRDQLASHTSLLSKASPPPVPPVLYTSVGVQTAAPIDTSAALSLDTRPPHALTPSIYSVTPNGVVRSTRLDRHASLKTARVLAATPLDAARGVADRVAAALADPVRSLPYLHSLQFGADVVELSAQASAAFEREPRCVAIQSPVHVFGDIHGNYTDLRFFADTMWPKGLALTPGSFLFLGDYVDRGASSLECVAYLFAHKLLHPHKLVLLRGNHETRAVNGLEAHYGATCLLAQCKARFGVTQGAVVWHEINHAFDRLPLAAVIDSDIFCVHGGVPRPFGSSSSSSVASVDASPSSMIDSILRLPTIAQLDVLDARYYRENAPIAMVSDMLWGDPVPDALEPSMDTATGFGPSVRGGVAVSFGDRAIERFLAQHRFSRILRAHEAKIDGVAVSKSARVVTVFSTSKDHGLGDDASCGCLLVDHGRIVAINRSPLERQQQLQQQRRRSLHCQSASRGLVASRVQGEGFTMTDMTSVRRESGDDRTRTLQQTIAPRRRFQIAALADDVASSARGVPLGMTLAGNGNAHGARTSSSNSSNSSCNISSSSGDSDSTDDEEDDNDIDNERIQRPRTALAANVSHSPARLVPAGHAPNSMHDANDVEEDNNQHE